ncbi:MAG TPA: DUF3574 domain-containing protein [Hyphomonadaceae bacterium]|nr:DUF3574 domain-containing protein [Hyphomonadaceae bacterium]
MRSLFASFALLSTTGCISVSDAPAPASGACLVGRPMVETMLFLGMASPVGPVTPQAFQAFVETEVTPRWKEGYTILEGQGLWYSDQRHITEREPSRVLVRFHDGSLAASADIEAIRKAYIAQFKQDAVLRTDRPACADF